MDIVYVENGPLKFWDSIAQLRKYYSGVIHVVVSQDALNSKKFAEFELTPYTIEEMQSFYPLRAFRKLSPGGWVAAETERLFLIEAFCRWLPPGRRKGVMVIRGDTFLHENPRHYAEDLRKICHPTSIAVCEGSSPEEYSTAVIYIHYHRALSVLTGGILALMKQRKFKTLFPVFPTAGRVLRQVHKQYSHLLALLPSTPASTNAWRFGNKLFGRDGVKHPNYVLYSDRDKKGVSSPGLVHEISGKRYNYVSMSK